MSEAEKWILGCTIIVALCTVAAVVISIIALNKKQDVKVEQPLSVEMVESLVTKDDFNRHVEKNDEIHDQLFSKLGGVERGSRDNNEVKVSELRRELNSTNATMHELKGEMKQLTSQLVLIQQELAKR